ncbi:MAG: hypothetical protein EP344_16440 [Bacteroidetes bacterium]|nr:MAG: hypothetical protein EP344_16440 [Bacteroidota bacterium]
MKNNIHGLVLLLEVGLLAVVTLVPRNLFVTTQSPEAGTRSDAFQKFLKQFPDAAFPYDINKEEALESLQAAIGRMKEDGPMQSVGNGLEDPDHFLPGSRMALISRVPSFLEPVAHLATARHHVVIYLITRGFSFGHRTYVATTFDKKGKCLASHEVAAIGDIYLKTFAVDTDLNATVENYKVNWEKDRYDAGIEENTITSVTLETSEVLDLTEPAPDPFRRKPENKAKPVELPKALGAILVH